jgi:carboxylate-amine ligase
VSGKAVAVAPAGPGDRRFAPTPEWAEWKGRPADEAWTVGIEEEVMLVTPGGWALAYEADDVRPGFGPVLAARASAEVHGAALELGTGVHADVPSAVRELGALRRGLHDALAGADLRAASAGTHPFALWSDTVLSAGQRYEAIYGSMRELARREPTFGLHVHVGVPDPDDAFRVFDRMRGHIPLFLALSANSPFWQGRDTGLASARTPLFQAFPRVGIPRRFASYEEWIHTVGVLVDQEAIAEPTFLWWDVRPQPRFGTVEVRIMDAQTTLEATAAVAALVQCVACLELREGFAGASLLELPEVLEENRFLAARDGMRAEFVDPDGGRRLPARELLERIVVTSRVHAQDLGCEAELLHALELGGASGAADQLVLARGPDRLPGLVRALSDRFVGPGR